jgi:hypothetical protein
MKPEDFPQYEPEDPKHPVSEKSNKLLLDNWYR